MSTKIKFMLKCDEANHVCDKVQYKNASFWEKVKLSIHLVLCEACRKYTRNNVKLTKIIKKSHVTCLDRKCKQTMKLKLDKAIKETGTNLP
ncbi:hypothetical protein [Mariniflexile maritimum]|uniref:hypothetical protein n=1 Tax=Mariniflexile maritimum TaxID=2682493 RepID=UPI0012F63964|nr:hypothetical protein [Mariniflexile maritimum]